MDRACQDEVQRQSHHQQATVQGPEAWSMRIYLWITQLLDRQGKLAACEQAVDHVQSPMDGVQEDDSVLDQEKSVFAVNVQVQCKEEKKRIVQGLEQQENICHAIQDICQVPDDAVCARWHTSEIQEVQKTAANNQEQEIEL